VEGREGEMDSRREEREVARLCWMRGLSDIQKPKSQLSAKCLCCAQLTVEQPFPELGHFCIFEPDVAARFGLLRRGFKVDILAVARSGGSTTSTRYESHERADSAVPHSLICEISY
jgi:hypothetical protein